jgi:hypothetical protein
MPEKPGRGKGSSKGEKVTRDWRKLRKEKINDLGY